MMSAPTTTAAAAAAATNNHLASLLSPTTNYFLCPTGAGSNSDTLTKPILEGCPVWGFCSGSAKNFRQHVRSGDVFLFTAPSTGRFNRVGVVREWREDPTASVSSQFWAPMAYSMARPYTVHFSVQLDHPLVGG